MAAGAGNRGVLADLFLDLRQFHDRWMGLVFPRQVNMRGTVLGKWQPRTTGEVIQYRLWGLLGALVVALVYPVALVGTVLRFQTRRIEWAAASLGVLGVLVVSGLVWGALAVVARATFPFGAFVAITAAGVVATISAVGGLAFGRIGGRGSTVLVAYPLGVTAIFLPPVVAALYSPTLASIVFPGSRTLAVVLLSAMPDALARTLTAQFDLVGLGYVLLWFALAIPVGWLLGSLVTLAYVVRPTKA